jgi:hypothetical protein
MFLRVFGFATQRLVKNIRDKVLSEQLSLMNFYEKHKFRSCGIKV